MSRKQSAMRNYVHKDLHSQIVEGLKARIRKLEIEAEIAERLMDNVSEYSLAAVEFIRAVECHKAPEDDEWCNDQECARCALSKAEGELMFTGHQARMAVQEIDDVVEATVVEATCYFSGHVRVAVRGGEPLDPDVRAFFERDGDVWVDGDDGEEKLDRLPVAGQGDGKDSK